MCDVRIIEGPIPSPTPDSEVITRASSVKNDKYDCITTCKFDNTGKGEAYFILRGSPSNLGLAVETMPPVCVDEERQFNPYHSFRKGKYICSYTSLVDIRK